MSEEGSTKVKISELKDIILRYQNNQQKGYYKVQDWKQVNSVLFGVHEDETVLNTWRILKLINFGDEYVPTGLVYDTLLTLIDIQQQALQSEFLLKNIFFKFIEFNGKYLTPAQQNQLAYFKVIRKLVEGYRKLITNTFTSKSQANIKSSKSRSQQLYSLYNVFTYKKNLQKLINIDEQFKQCTFEPQINRNSIVQSRYLMSQSEIKSKEEIESEQYPKIQNHISENSEEQSNCSCQFKASPVPSYPNVSPLGINQHLERMKRSRELGYMNCTKAYNKSNVTEFNIEERQRQRRMKMMSTYQMLFMIKVQVGRKIYRVKVRENMTPAEVVHTIEMMVGFKNLHIENIVEGYFHKWKLREQESH